MVALKKKKKREEKKKTEWKINAPRDINYIRKELKSHEKKKDSINNKSLYRTLN